MTYYTIQDEDCTIELCRNGRSILLRFNNEEEAYYLSAEVAEGLHTLLSKLLFKD